jgi:uncharacterized protein YbjT (DUF2867 family)
MRVLVLGGYGLIGSEVVRRLRAEGLDVVGFGRTASKGKRLFCEIEWRGGDLNKLCSPASWAAHLDNIDAVVNASGALQDGLKDALASSQDQAIGACIEACATRGVQRFVQISAPGAAADARTAFMRTKASADQKLRASTLSWTILKPGLVIGAYAYGGAALMRMLAAFPYVQPLMLAQARIQTVAAEDVAEAVLTALTSERIMRSDVDLVERQAHTLAEIVAALRAWLGFAPARATIEAPRFVGVIIGRCADLAGWLGWRSPLRTTAMIVLANNVLADAESGERALGRPLKSLAASLGGLPATLQERTFARVQLAFPLLVAALGSFWIASGAIALAHIDAAALVLRGALSPPTLLARGAEALVVGAAALDIAIGVGVLVRATIRLAALAAIATSLIYLALGTLLTPHLWADPLGPLVKIIPGMALALAVAALAEER